MSTELRSPAHYESMLAAPRAGLSQALVLNGRQALALADPSPECDSLIELFDRIRPDTDREAMTIYQGRRLVTNVIRWNSFERLHVEGSGAVLGAVAADLHSDRLTGSSMRERLNARSLASVLRVPLGVLARLPLAEGGDAGELLEAVRVLVRVARETPRSQLLSPALAYHLSPRKARLLHLLLEDTESGTVAPAALHERSAGSDHGRE